MRTSLRVASVFLQSLQGGSHGHRRLCGATSSARGASLAACTFVTLISSRLITSGPRLTPPARATFRTLPSSVKAEEGAVRAGSPPGWPSCPVVSPPTCAEEEHVVVPAVRVQPVHQQPPQPVGHIDPDQHGLPALRVHGLPHQLVAAHEADQLVGEVLGGLQEGVVRLTGALCDTGAALGPGRSVPLPSSCSPFAYRAGPGVRNTALVFYPAVVEALLVCEGAAEGSSHGGHGVDADGRAAEDTTVGGHRALSVPAAPRGPGVCTPTPRSLAVPCQPCSHAQHPGAARNPFDIASPAWGSLPVPCQSCGLTMGW